MATLPHQRLGSRGIGLLEVIAAATVAAILVFSISAFINSSTKQAVVTKGLYNLQMEHEALRALVMTIPTAKAGNILCGSHPHMKYNSDNGKCLPATNKDGNFYGAPTAAEVAAFNDLSRTVFEWATYQSVDAGHLPPQLDQTFFTDKVLPKMTTAKCFDCHDGTFKGADPIFTKDFRSFATLTTPPELASRAMFSAPLGRKLLATQMPLTALFPYSQGISHTLTFVNSTTCAPSGFEVRTFVDTDAAKAACPGDCNAGEYPNPETCNTTCNAFDKPASSTEPAKCLQWQRTVECRIPSVRCSPPPTCTSPKVLVPNSCLENQLSSCGVGSTVYRCVEPSAAAAGQKGIVQFTITTLGMFGDATKEPPRRLTVDGALP